MTSVVKMGLAVAGTSDALALGGALYIGSGIYNIGADDHHTKIVLAIIEAIAASAPSTSASCAIDALRRPKTFAEDRRRCANAMPLCASAVTSGTGGDEIRHPRWTVLRTRRILRKRDTRNAQRAFWTIKHGIKMSAMPAWGKSLDDAAIWDIVSFVRKMPAMTPQACHQ